MSSKKYPFLKTDEEWKQILNAEEYYILREKGTEKKQDEERTTKEKRQLSPWNQRVWREKRQQNTNETTQQEDTQDDEEDNMEAEILGYN